MERTQLKTVSHRKLGFKVHTHPAILENTRVCFGQLPFSSMVCGDDSYVPPSNIFCESPKRVPCVLCCCEGGEKDSVNSLNAKNADCPKRERKNQTAQTVMRQIHIVQLLHPRFVNGVQRNVVLRGCCFLTGIRKQILGPGLDALSLHSICAQSLVSSRC